MAAQYNKGADSSQNGSSGVAASSATTQSASAAQPPTASEETCVQSLCKKVKREMDLRTQESSLQIPNDVAVSSALLTRRPLGKVHYRPAPGAELQTGEVSETTLWNGKVSTALKYKEVVYPNAMEWMSTVFKNSGRACYHIIPKSVVEMGDTPRAKFYMPPDAKCRFGRYLY